MAEESNIQSMGGIARAEKLSPKQRGDIARRAALARWTNALKSTHEGQVPIGDAAVHCAVLNDGRRVLSQSGFMKSLGRARQAKGRDYYRGDVNLPAFLTAQNLKPFIPKDLEVTSSQVEYQALNGTKAYGYPAELLPAVVGVFIDADRAGVILASQRHIADRAYILSKALMNVAIAALIDEATGYQDVRDRKALQAILDKYLRKEYAAWAKRFPLELYKEIFRLKGWEWNGGKMPGVVGRYTNDLVYARLAPGVLDELRKLNPPNERGQRRHKHHQFLTEDVGHPALNRHLYELLGMMRASDDWDRFRRVVDRSFPKLNTNLLLPFSEETD